MNDIIIIGAGTAGMTAAVYAARADKDTLVLEQTVCGGQIVNAPNVENYPAIKAISGADFAMALYEQAADLGAKFVFANVTNITKENGVFTVTADGRLYSAKAVIIATGAKNRPLGLENESSFVGRGVSYCATCDGAFYKNKAAVVAGGGNTAVDDALFLSDLCRQVYVVHRRDTFRAESKKTTAMYEKENITVLTNTVVTAINGERKVDSVTLHNKETDTDAVIDTDALFIAVGQMPQNMVFAKLAAIDKSGYVEAGENCKTKTAGLFAAGDCRAKQVRQLSTAAADGTVAGVSAVEYVNAL